MENRIDGEWDVLHAAAFSSAAKGNQSSDCVRGREQKGGSHLSVYQFVELNFGKQQRELLQSTRISLSINCRSVYNWKEEASGV